MNLFYLACCDEAHSCAEYMGLGAILTLAFIFVFVVFPWLLYKEFKNK